jgi:hypothetical protein
MAGAVVTVVVGVRHVRTGGARSDDVVRRIWRAHVGLECEQAQAIVSNHRCTGREGYVVCIVENILGPTLAASDYIAGATV